MNNLEADLALLCFRQGVQLDAEMFGNFRGCAGKTGGGSFMLVYIICLIVLGIPSLIMEFAVGRAAQTSPIHMYKKLEKPGQKWGGFGWVCLWATLR